MTKNHYLSKMLIVLILSLSFLIVFSPVKKAEAVSNGGDPYIGQISLFPYNFAPLGWVKCQGQSMGISSNQALFALLGTQYGSNGQTTFNIPDLRGASPINGVDYYISTLGLFPTRDYSDYGGVLGEIGLFPYNFTPGGWALCDGSLLGLNSNAALFSLIGTTFGGNGATNFALPNLQQCAPIAGLHYCISVTGNYPQSYGNGEDQDFMGAIDLFPNNSVAAGDSGGMCKGQLMSITSNQALFSLLGTNFGGDGRTNFALPDLRGAVPDPHLRYFIQLNGIYPSRS